MLEVTQKQFYAFIAARAAEDPMPSTERPDVTLWKTKGGQRVIARSYPGWRNPGEPERYEIEEES